MQRLHTTSAIQKIEAEGSTMSWNRYYSTTPFLQNHIIQTEESKSNQSSTSLPYLNSLKSLNNLSLTPPPNSKASPCHIHYFVNSKSIPYHQGRTYSRFDGLVLTLKFLS
ncbi:hypothetical protein ACFX15_032252 [Malus domestica]